MRVYVCNMEISMFDDYGDNGRTSDIGLLHFKFNFILHYNQYRLPPVPKIPLSNW